MTAFCQLLKGEFLKQRRSFTWPLLLLTPVVAGGLTFINLFVRYDYLMSLEGDQGFTSWNLLLLQHHFLWMFFLPLVVTVFSSMIHHMEYRSNSWKNIFALPVSKRRVYLAKWFAVFLLGSLMVWMNGVVLMIVGKLLGFPEGMDFILILKYTLYQMAAMMSLISFQCCLSAEIRNTNIVLAVGFVGVASSLFFAQSETLSKFIPYAHLIYALPDPTVDNQIAFRYGLVFGVFFLLLGVFSFCRKEID